MKVVDALPQGRRNTGCVGVRGVEKLVRTSGEKWARPPSKDSLYGTAVRAGHIVPSVLPGSRTAISISGKKRAPGEAALPHRPEPAIKHFIASVPPFPKTKHSSLGLSPSSPRSSETPLPPPSFFSRFSRHSGNRLFFLHVRRLPPRPRRGFLPTLPQEGESRRLR